MPINNEGQGLDNQYLAYRNKTADEEILREFLEKTAPEPVAPAVPRGTEGAGADGAKNAARAPRSNAEGEGADLTSLVTGKPRERSLAEATGVFIRELPRAVAGGALGAVRSTVNAVDDLAMSLEERFPLGGIHIGTDGIRLLSSEEYKARRGDTSLADEVALPKLPDPSTPGGKAVKGIAQFVTGLIPASRVTKFLGVAGKAKPLATGAIADFTAFEGDEGRLSDLVQSVPALQNPVTEFLASEEDDTALEGRFKNAVEGLGLGVAVDVLFSGLKAYKVKRKAAMELQDAAIKDPEKLAQEIDQLEPDALLPPVMEKDVAARMGDPVGPRIIRTPKVAPADPAAAAAVTKMQAAERRAGETMDQALERINKPNLGAAAKGSSAEAGETVSINLARINSSEDVKAAMLDLASLDRKAINAARQNKRMTFEEMSKLADGVGMSPEELLKRTGPMTVEQTIAARRLWVATTEQVTELAKKAASPEATPADLVAFRKAMSVQYAVQAEVLAERTAQARALASWRIEAGGSRERAQMLQRLLDESGGAEVSVEMARKIAMMGDNPAAVSAFVRKADRATTIDVLQEYFVTGLLTSPKTHVVNATSNSLTSLWAIPERLLSGAVSQTIGDGDIALREATALAWGQVKASREGLKLFWKTLKSGEPSGTIKVEQPRIPAISAERLGLSGTTGRAVDFLGSVQRSGSRLLMATDEFFKTIAYRGEVHAQAYRTAASEGLTGKAAAERIAHLVEHPPEGIRMDAAKFADVQTFTNDLGDAGKAFQNWANKTPGMKFIVPFVRTPVNIMKYAFHRTPIAPFLGSVKQELAAGGARRDTAMAKVALGTTTMLTIADLVSEGNITGGGPSDGQLKQARQRQGIPDYGIKVGDTWYKYNRLDPLGMMIGMAADVSEIVTHVDEEDSDQLVLAGGLAFAKNLTSKTYLEGISSLIEVIDDPDRYGPQWVSNFAGSFIPLSGLTRNVANAIDTTRRETKTAIGDPDVDRFRDTVPDPVAEFAARLVNEAKARTPGFGADLPPKRDLWGRPVDISSHRGMAYDFLSPVPASEENPDPVDQMILDNRVPVTMPQRVIDGVRLTNDEYSTYSQKAGELAKQQLDQLVAGGAFDGLSDGPDGMKSNLIRNIVMSARAAAQAQMMAENLELRERIIERKQERARVIDQGGKVQR